MSAQPDATNAPFPSQPVCSVLPKVRLLIHTSYPTAFMYLLLYIWEANK